MIDRAYYRLHELAKRWSCTVDDLLHLADIGKLQLTAALVVPQDIDELTVEVFDFNSEPVDRRLMRFECMTGVDGDLFHLSGPDSRLLARTGELTASFLHTLDGRYVLFHWPAGRAFRVTTENVVVLSKDAERARAALQGAHSSTQTQIHRRLESTYLAIIGAMLELIRNPRSGRDSDAAVIRELIANYGDKPGIKKSTLEAKFAAARRFITQD